MFNNRKQGLQIASAFLAFTMLFSIPTFVSAKTTSKTAKKIVVAKSKKPSLPKIYVSGLQSNYTYGQVPTFKAWSTGYNKTVQYKILLINQQSKKSLDLTRGYTKAYNYKTKFSYKLSKLSAGKYKVYIYVRRAGLKVSYDSYTIRNIVVSNASKTISLNKNGQVFGGSKVSTVNNDIVVTGDKVTLNNLKVNGTLIINPGEKGTTNLNNISVKNVQVLSGGQNSIHFNDVAITGQLLVQSKNVNNPVRIETKGDTEIASTQVKSDVILDSAKGSFGNVVIVNNSQGTSNVELRGTFDKEITVQASAQIKTAVGAVVPSLVVAPENQDTKVVLDGSFQRVAVNKETKVELTDNAQVKEEIKVNAQAAITASPKAEVAKVEIAPENKDSKVTLSGNFKSVEVNKEAKLEVASGKIDNVVTNAKADISVAKDAEVTKTDTKGNDTKVSGDGKKGDVTDSNKPTPVSHFVSTAYCTITSSFDGAVTSDFAVTRIDTNDNSYKYFGLYDKVNKVQVGEYKLIGQDCITTINAVLSSINDLEVRISTDSTGSSYLIPQQVKLEKALNGTLALTSGTLNINNVTWVEQPSYAGALTLEFKLNNTSSISGKYYGLFDIGTKTQIGSVVPVNQSIRSLAVVLNDTSNLEVRFFDASNADVNSPVAKATLK